MSDGGDGRVPSSGAVSDDPIHDISAPGTRWSRNNTAEAVPGVVTPMAWAFFGVIGEVNYRRGFCELGLISPAAVYYPESADDRISGIFHGRWALNAGVIRQIMGALPGVTGDEVERDILGYVPEGVAEDPPWRAPAILAKAPRQLLWVGRRAEATRARLQEWWVRSAGPGGPRPGVEPRALLREAMDNFGEAMVLQSKTRMVFQGVSAQLIELAEAAGAGESAASLLSGAADLEETRVADDLWLVAQDRLTLQGFIARHGYHGPDSGNIATHSWREDPRPVERLLDGVRVTERPADRAARAASSSETVAEEVIANLPPSGRLRARLSLRLAPSAARNLERTKTAFLIAIDGGRAATRAIGDELVSAGLLTDREDAFHLMPEELLDPDRTDLAELAATRREAHRYHSTLELPETWTGQPTPVPHEPDDPSQSVERLTGAGVSPGTIEGIARVVHDPADVETVELGEVLVAKTTDPSWVSLMTIAGALVIDIGTAASHSAVVARELGIPCVIGTKTGTRDLRDGDRIRVDGGAGTVEVLGSPVGEPS